MLLACLSFVKHILQTINYTRSHNESRRFLILPLKNPLLFFRKILAESQLKPNVGTSTDTIAWAICFF